MAPEVTLRTPTEVEVGSTPCQTEQIAAVRREAEAFLSFIALKSTNAALRDPDLLEDAFQAVAVSDAFIANDYLNWPA